MIVTFYSFKGGVGRSMALANVARWFRLNGLRVVVVDWDLEAPGLESYFAGPASGRDLRSAPGLIDLLTSYQARWASLPWPLESAGSDDPASREAGGPGDGGAQPRRPRTAALEMLQERLPPLAGLLQLIEGGDHGASSRSDAPLWLLSAGARDGDRFKQYADAVQNFDWAQFYDRYDGETFFEWLRMQLDMVADVTLIDSRTGVTEMGGICTRHLADVVVALCATNEANLAGVERVMSVLGSSKLLELRGRPLDVIPVPARVDRQAENTRSIEWRDSFIRRMTAQLGRDAAGYWEMHLPYVPYYAFEEKLVVGEADGSEFLDKAYRALGLAVATRLAERADDTTKLRILQQNRDDTAVAELLASPDLVGESAWRQLDEAQQPMALRLLLRLVRVGGAEERVDAPAVVDVAVLSDPERAMVSGLCTLHLVTVKDVEGRRLVRLAFDKLTTWKRLSAAIEQDRQFLLWRQQLDAFVNAWQRSSRDEGTLMTGHVLEEASSMLRDRAADLLPAHVDFVEASRRYADQQREHIRGLTEEKEELSRKLEEARSQHAAPRRSMLPRSLWAIAAGALLVVGLLFSDRLVPTAVDGTGATETALRDAEAAYGRGDFQASAEAATRAIGLSPGDARGYLRRGQARVPLGQPADALADFDAAIKLAGPPAAYVAAAGIRQDEKNFAAAREILTQGIERNPTDSSLHRALGGLDEAEGRRDEAQIAYTSAVRVDPNDGQAYFARARLFLDAKAYDEASADLQKAVAVSRDPALVTSAIALLAKVRSSWHGESDPGVVVNLRYGPDSDRRTVESVRVAFEDAGFPLDIARDDGEEAAGSVRYFNHENETIAVAIKTLVESSLAKGGQPTRLLLSLSDAPESEGAKRVEVRLPARNASALPTG